MKFRNNGKHARKRKLGLAALVPVTGALALSPVIVHPGDTLSGIAASHGVSLGAVERANPQIHNPNLIFAGQAVNIPGGESGTGSSSGSGGGAPAVYHAPRVHHYSGVRHHVSHHHAASHANTSGNYSSSDLADIPGVPRDFAACVAFRESTNGTNQAYNGGVYGIITASGINVNGQSLAAQKAAFAKLYAQYGKQPWSPSDGC